MSDPQTPSEPLEPPTPVDLSIKLESDFLESRVEYLSSPERHNSQWNYEFVPGFFSQSELPTDSSGPFPIPSLIPELRPRSDYHFGLSCASWDELKSRLADLNSAAPPNVSYKLLFLARHGQGFHNRAEQIYGAEKWYSELSRKNGDGKLTWGPDAQLTELGVAQAQAVNAAWKAELACGAPLPSVYFSSPFTRAADTCVYTWRDLAFQKGFVPHMTEPLRECSGIFTCDKRNTREFLCNRFDRLRRSADVPDAETSNWFSVDSSVTPEDTLWRPDRREKLSEHAERVHKWLDGLFQDYKEDVFVSVTSHGGTTRAFCLVAGHPNVRLAPGEMIPLVVKGVKRPQGEEKEKEGK